MFVDATLDMNRIDCGGGGESGMERERSSSSIYYTHTDSQTDMLGDHG